MLSLTEELFVLCLLDKKNTITLPYSASLPYILAGTMLAELALAGKIQLDKGKSIAPTGDSESVVDNNINELLAKIRTSAKPRKISHWIISGAGKGKKLEKELLVNLIELGLLSEEEKRFQWVIQNNQSLQPASSIKYQRKQNLRDIIFSGKIADLQSVALLRFLKAFDLLDNIFTVDELRFATSRVDEIIKDDSFGKSMMETLEVVTSMSVAVALAITSKK